MHIINNHVQSRHQNQCDECGKQDTDTQKIAMGIRNLACFDVSMIMGAKPPKVVSVVSRIGRKRWMPADTIVDYNINSKAYRLEYFQDQGLSCFWEVGIVSQTIGAFENIRRNWAKQRMCAFFRAKQGRIWS